MIVPIDQGMNTFQGAASLAVIGVLGLWALAVFSRRVKSTNVFPASLAAALAGFAVLMVLIAADGNLLADENAWHALGEQAASFLTGATVERVAYVDGKEGYVWIVGFLYAIAGPVPLAPILANLVLSSLTVVCVARITELVIDGFPAVGERWQKTAVLTAALLTALLPSIFIWTPRVLRETISLFLISVAVLACVQLVRSRKVSYLLIAISTVVTLSWIRGPIGMALGVALAVATTFVWSRRSPYHLAIRFFLMIPLALALTAAWSIANEQFGLSAEEVAFRNRALATESSSGFEGAAGTAGAQSYATILLVNVPRIAAGPFLWEIDVASASMLLAAMEGAIWIIVVLFAARALWIRRKLLRMPKYATAKDDHSATLVLLIAAGALLATMSVSVANYGLLARLRPMALVVIIPLAAIAVSYRPIARSAALMNNAQPRTTARPNGPRSRF